MKILFFGRIKDNIGIEKIEVNSELAEDIESLKKYLFDKFPLLKKEVFAIAVNQEIKTENVKLKEDDEIALLPPIAGG